MNIVIAIDSFKGSISALTATRSVEKGIKKVIPDAKTYLFPVADGGEGTTDAVLASAGGKKIKESVFNPLFEKTEAEYAILKDGSAVIETAAASGLTLIEKEKRNLMISSSYGTGELILSALKKGVERIIFGLGGSATNDGGIGLGAALGIKFYDKAGNELKPIAKELINVAKIDVSGLTPLIKNVKFDIACDVTNPLCGEKGASYVFGPQKGASPEDVFSLDKGLQNFAKVLKETCGKDFTNYPGAGAAGGIAILLLAFAKTEIHSGIELILNSSGIDEKIKDCDLVITGEGRVDMQTAFGKVPAGVAKHAKAFNKPVIALTGSIGNGYEAVYDCGIDAVFSVQSGPMSLEESLENADKLLSDTAERVLRLFML